MKMISLFAMLLLLIVPAIAAADDPVKAAPDKYKSLLDNDRVRVLDVTLKAGEKSPMHSHPAYVVYVLTEGKVRFTGPDGKSEEVMLTAGKALWRPAESHGVENLGGTDVRVLNVELKEPKGSGRVQPGGEDPVKVAPDIYRVLLENERVRVLQVDLPAGGISRMHWHPDTVIYPMGDAQTRFIDSAGKAHLVQLKAGVPQFIPAESHAATNEGAEAQHVLLVELKEQPARRGAATRPAGANHIMLPPANLKWQPAPPSLPPGAELAVLEGDPTKPGPFTMRGKFPAGYRIPPHWHPGHERVTVITGTFYMGMGGTFDKSKAVPLPPGAFAIMPTGMHHFAFTEEETIVQVHGDGPWGITYVNPADDPQKR